MRTRIINVMIEEAVVVISRVAGSNQPHLSQVFTDDQVPESDGRGYEGLASVWRGFDSSYPFNHGSV